MPGHRVVNDLAELRALPLATLVDGDLIEVCGLSGPRSGLGGTFQWRSGAPNADDGVDHVRPASGGGAFARIFNELRVYNVRAFGAPGDGSDANADHAAILQALAAIAAAPSNGAVNTRGGVLYFPAGLYRLQETIELPSCVTVRGAGNGPPINDPQGTTVLDAERVSCAFRTAREDLRGREALAYRVGLEDLTISNTQGFAIEAVNAMYVDLRRVTVTGTSTGGLVLRNEYRDGPSGEADGHGVRPFGCQSVVLQDCVFKGLTGRDAVAVSVEATCNEVVIDRCDLSQNPLAVRATGCTGLKLCNSNFEGHGVGVELAGAEATITGCRFEGKKIAILVLPQILRPGTPENFRQDSILQGMYNHYTKWAFGGGDQVVVRDETGRLYATLFEPLATRAIGARFQGADGQPDPRLAPLCFANLEPGQQLDARIGAVTWAQGNGEPEGRVSAPDGSLYSRIDGGNWYGGGRVWAKATHPLLSLGNPSFGLFLLQLYYGPGARPDNLGWRQLV